MKYIKYNENSQTYSRIIAGCMRWGLWGAQFDTSAYANMIEAALQLGITSFDHADIYGDYTTEAEFGKGLEAAKIDRTKVQLITKCGIRMKTSNRSGNKIKSYDHSKSYILDSVDQSLTNLKTEYIDMLLLHRPSPLMRVEEVAEAFSQLKTSGKVRDFGVSNFTTDQFNLLNKYTPLATNQIQASPIHLQSFKDGTLENLQKEMIKPQAWSPLGGANLFSTQVKQEEIDRMIRFQMVCEEYNWSLSEMALLFLMHHPAVISPILGTTNSDRLKKSVTALDKDIDDEQWFEIWSASTGEEVA